MLLAHLATHELLFEVSDHILQQRSARRTLVHSGGPILFICPLTPSLPALCAWQSLVAPAVAVKAGGLVALVMLAAVPPLLFPDAACGSCAASFTVLGERGMQPPAVAPLPPCVDLVRAGRSALASWPAQRCRPRRGRSGRRASAAAAGDWLSRARSGVHRGGRGGEKCG